MEDGEPQPTTPDVTRRRTLPVPSTPASPLAPEEVFPSYGGCYEVEGVNVKYSNTCSADNWITFLKVIQVNDQLLFEEMTSWAAKLGADEVVEVLQKIGISAFNEVKYLIAEMLNLTLVDGVYNFFQSEINMRSLTNIFLQHEERSLCSGKNCPERETLSFFADGPSIPPWCASEHQVMEELRSWLLQGWDRLCNMALEPTATSEDLQDVRLQSSLDKKAL